jgi:hypothetical protein
MNLRKEKWQYELPADTHELLRGYLRNGTVDYALQQVLPCQIHHWREENKRKGSGELLGYVAYIAVEPREDKIFLLTYPTPAKAGKVLLLATKVVEL